MNSDVATQSIERSIRMIRGQKVLLDIDLANLYGVSVGRLNEQVRRNLVRFPADFMFQLDGKEATNLKSQFAISSWGGRRSTPLAFTEQGVAMLSSVLRSAHAVEVNVEIMRAFVRLRRLLDSNVELSRRLDALERRYDGQFRAIFDAIRELMAPPRGSQRSALDFSSSHETHLRWLRGVLPRQPLHPQGSPVCQSGGVGEGLIDGRRVAELMVDFEVGVTTIRTFHVKRVDSDYFEEA